MRGTARSLFAALILIALVASLPGCAYQRPDELTFGEVWRFKNLVISGSPDLASRLMQHREFTYDNVVRLREGASPDEVRAVFGPPDKTRFRIFGLETPDPWRGMVFEYCMGYHFEGRYSKNSNILIFTAETSPPRLRFWDIQMVYKDRQALRPVSGDRAFLP